MIGFCASPVFRLRIFSVFRVFRGSLIPKEELVTTKNTKGTKRGEDQFFVALHARIRLPQIGADHIKKGGWDPRLID